MLAGALLSCQAYASVEYTTLPPFTPTRQALALRLEKLEALLAQASAYQRYILLDTAGRTAMELNEYRKAEQYARALVELSDSYPNDWNYASALHHSRIILGRCALKNDDISSAKRYLLAAGQIPSSNALNHSGPDIKLASELLKRGERAAVITYLKACRSIWPGGLEKLDHWLDLLDKGVTPDFGVH